MLTEPRRVLTPEQAERCEYLQFLALAVAQDLGEPDRVAQIGLSLDEAMRKWEQEQL